MEPACRDAALWACSTAHLRLLLGTACLLASVLAVAGEGSAEEVPHAQSQGEQSEPGRAAPSEGAIDVRMRATRDLYSACLAEQGAASGWCSAYLMGVADTLAAFGDEGNKAGICAADYTIEQLAEAFLTWAKGNDTSLDVDMLAGASLAFRQKWPCR